MVPRIHYPEELISGAVAALGREAGHYLRNVLRRDVGSPVSLFNDRDGEFEGTLVELSKKGALVRIDRLTRSCEAEPDIALLVAPVKKAAMETIIQKAVELGVQRLTPVLTERTQGVRLNSDRLWAIGREAAEQCGRLSVPDVEAPIRLPVILGAWPSGRRLIFCDEAGDDPAAPWGGRNGRATPMLEALSGLSAGPASILIGPEGGFSAQERDMVRSHPSATPVTLGPRILRADTAAIAALTLWQAVLGDLRRS